MNDLKDNLIAGEWKKATSYSPNINPSNLADVIGEYAQGDAGDVDAAVAAATAAFPAWATGSIQARSDALDKIGTEILARREELGTLLSREEGKTRAEGIGEVTRAGQIFKFFAGECLRLSGELLPSVRPGIGVEITREPIGVVGLITPWNFPIAIPGLEDRAGAGLRQLRGPQARRPRARLRLGAGRDHLALGHPGRRVQPGDGPRQRDRRCAGQTIPASTRSASPARSASVAHRGCMRARATRRCSSRWAARTRRSCSTTPTSAQAVELSVQSAFYSTGQRCTASSRLIVTEGIYPKFVEAMKARMAQAEGRRRAGGGHRHRPGLEPEPARAGPELHRDRPGAKARRWPRAASG